MSADVAATAGSLNEATLDEIRLALAPEIASAAAFDGWSEAGLEQAAALHGVPAAVAKLAFPGGPMDMIAAWIASIDAQMEAAFADGALDGMKIRDKIRTLVLFRIDAVAGRKEALRRGLAIMALPQNLPRAFRTAWNSADAMWRVAGDTATDYNHYTKRALLAGIYSGTLAVFIEDDSAHQAATRAFLDRRIDEVMRFEKAKGQMLNRERFDFVRFLGRLRYPARSGFRPD